jgi:tetratricopeptide (TPR) repeat protein
VQPLEQVAKRLKGLIIKRPGMALGLWGEAGIGKTHTTHNLLQEIPCKNLSQHATTSISNLARALPKPKKLAVWVTRIFEKLEGNQVLTTEQTTSAFGVVLSGIAPFILHLEDIHEANPEQLEWIVAMAKVITRLKGVALVVTSRSEPPEPFEALRLEKLDFEAVKNLLESEAQASLPTEAITWIHGKAAGNPLFTLEFFRFLARQGSLWNDGQRWRFRTPERETMPVTVEALIEQMLRDTASSPVLENVLCAKAILGLGVSEQLWAEVAGLTLEDLNALKQELEHHGVLSGNEFAHPLFREVVLAQMPGEQRQRFARRALEVLKDDPRVAAEFVKDAGLEDAQALGWFQRAAQAASNTGDKIQAARFKGKAVDYAEGEEKGRLALEVARELRPFDLRGSSRFVDIVLRIHPENNEAILLRANLFALEGRIFDSQEMLERLPENQKIGDKWLFLQLELFKNQGNDVGILKMCQEYPKLLETNDPVLCEKIAFSLASCGDNTRALLIAEHGLAQLELTPTQRGSLLMPYAFIFSNQGDHLRAEKLLTQALFLFQQDLNLRSVSAAYLNRAIVWESLSMYSNMIVDLTEVIKLYIDLGDMKHLAYAQAVLGGALIQFSEYEQAEELLLESWNTLKQVDAASYLIMCEIQLSLLYLNWSSANSEVLALKYAQSAVEHSRNLGNPQCLLESLFRLAEVLTSRGNGSRGFALSEEMFKLLETIDIAKDRSNAYFARAKAFEALGYFNQALDAFHQVLTLKGDLLSIQTTLLEIDRLTNNLEGARVRLAWFEERGLKNSVNIALRYFPALKTNSDHVPITATFKSIAHLEVLGSIQITLKGQTTPVRGRKRQELLALLLEARISGRSEVSKLELVDKLYPDADEIQANTGIYDVVYQLRSSLGESALTTTANGYALGNLKTDVETFLETGNTRLWRGVYLEGLLLETSDTVRESVYLALRTRAEALLETNPSEVIRVGRLLCEADPYDLEALRLTVTGLRAGQNHRSLSRFYDSARTRFLEIGEVLPARWQDFLTQIGTTA